MVHRYVIIKLLEQLHGMEHRYIIAQLQEQLHGMVRHPIALQTADMSSHSCKE